MQRLPLVISLLVCLACRAGAADAGRPPNVLFIAIDDLRDWVTFSGRDPLGITPAIDRLAREGVVFRHAFVNAPSCTPCRSSLFSGRYFFNCGRGAILRNALWDESIPTFPLLLRSSGYTIGKSFKMWSPGAPGDAPYGRQAHAFETAGDRHNDFSESMTTLMREGRPLADEIGRAHV